MEALRVNGRRTFKSMAKELGISTSTVKSRYYKMKMSGLIIGTTARLNWYALGGYITQLCVRTIESDTDSVIKYINSLKVEKATIFCWEVIGHYNILAWLFLKDPMKIHIAKQMVQQHPSVLEANVMIFKDFKNHTKNIKL